MLNFSLFDYVRCPGSNGSFGIMNNHQNGIFQLNIGEIKVVKGGKNEFFATSGGFAEINNNEVLFLVESIEKSSEIDLDRAKSSLSRAEIRKSKNPSNFDYIRNEASLYRAINRLKVSKR
jgi:F-type H+-transporting ATPase subunit epsilon